MDKSLDATLLALLATLEERAKKKGEKSILKGVIRRLADTGINDELIAEIAALHPKKTARSKSVAKTKAHGKANGKAETSVSKAASLETPAAVG